MLQHAIVPAPDMAETHNSLANTFQEQGRQEEAIQSFRRAISLRPDYVEAHNNLGHTLQAQGDLDDAMELLSSRLVA